MPTRSKSQSQQSAEGQHVTRAPREHSGTSPTYLNDPERRTGELPDATLGSDVKDIARQVIGGKITQRDRVAARYLDRLAVPLGELLDVIGGFKDWAAVADACRKVLGEERGRDLGLELGWAAENLLVLALALGYEAIPDER